MAQTPPAPEPLLTPAEVSQMFRVDPKTVTRWANAGQLTSIRTLGGHRRYRESEVLALLNGSDTTQTVPAEKSQPTPAETPNYPPSAGHRADLADHAHTISVERLTKHEAERGGGTPGVVVVVERAYGDLVTYRSVIVGTPEQDAEKLAKSYGAVYVHWDGAK